MLANVFNETQKVLVLVKLISPLGFGEGGAGGGGGGDGERMRCLGGLGEAGLGFGG